MAHQKKLPLVMAPQNNCSPVYVMLNNFYQECRQKEAVVNIWERDIKEVSYR